MIKPIYSKIKYEELPLSNQPSPTLIFHKWQAYDWDDRNSQPWGKFETTHTRLKYLEAVNKVVKLANENHNYQNWFERYKKQLTAIRAINFEKEFKTNWRLLVGWGTNPTLETGIQLHHLFGFPYIPGSAVKGMIHHVAELELCENTNWKIEKTSPEDETLGKLEECKIIVLHAELIRILFGSIFIQKHENEYGLETPLNWLKIWEEKLRDNRAQKKLHQRVANLVSADHTGGMLTFFDAIPAEDTFSGEDVLQTDILNPHYQDYYQDTTNKIPPSDDQNPKPVYFLAVRPGVKFIFPYRIANFPVGEGRDQPEKERAKVLHNLTEQQIKEQVNGWLTRALIEWGAGAKTAAGYGYFEPV